jgi:hypothetical protein
MSEASEKQEVAGAWAPDLVIYHDKCADGIVAAWACWKRWGDTPEYRAANYGHKPPEDVAGKHILIVDFSWPAEELRAMVGAGARSIVVLDHHKTAREALEGFQVFKHHPDRFTAPTAALMLDDLRRGGWAPIVALFDMERSGARMAWDFVQPYRSAPRLVELVERYDLWRFNAGTRDHAEVLHLAIQAAPMKIAIIEALYHQLEDGDGPLIEGSAIYDWRAQLVDEIASRAHLRTVAGIEGVISVECPYSLVSAVGHHLLDKHPAAPFAAMSVTGEHAVTWSLRSHDDRADVSERAPQCSWLPRRAACRGSAHCGAEPGRDPEQRVSRYQLVPASPQTGDRLREPRPCRRSHAGCRLCRSSSARCRMTNATQHGSVDSRLWCLHHIGADDVHPAPDFATAQKWANWANECFAEHADISRFVVAVWPWSAEAHAGWLERSIAEWTSPEASNPSFATNDVKSKDAIPPDIAASVLAIGRAEWGSTPEHDADGHAAHIRDSVLRTADHFGQVGPQKMQGLYVEGTGTVICHTGTSPNSAQIARALTGAWNWLHDQSAGSEVRS